jgi:hypothetical protein
MKRSELRSFVQSGVSAINPQLAFDSGKLTDFNSNRNNEYPKVFYESVQEVPVDLVNEILPLDQWPVILHIGKKDSMDSIPNQYELLIDECDEVAQKLIRQYNLVLSDSEKVTVSGYTRQPFVKKHADCITGVILSFTLNVPDQTNLC